MKLLTRLAAVGVFAAGLALSASAANAAPGIASTNANLRAGPGTGYAIVGSLKAGEYVVVTSCSPSWCKIRRVGTDGYVSRGLLFNPYYGSRRFYQFPPATPDPGRIVTR